jgi:hypothetical protein
MQRPRHFWSLLLRLLPGLLMHILKQWSRTVCWQGVWLAGGWGADMEGGVRAAAACMHGAVRRSCLLSAAVCCLLREGGGG